MLYAHPSCRLPFLKKEVYPFNVGFDQKQTKRVASYDNYPSKRKSSQAFDPIVSSPMPNIQTGTSLPTDKSAGHRRDSRFCLADRFTQLILTLADQERFHWIQLVYLSRPCLTIISPFLPILNKRSARNCTRLL